MNVTLTEEQAQAVASAKGEEITLTNPLTNEDFVLIRAEVYARLRASLFDDTVYTTAEMIDRVMADDDANDPLLAQLQRKYGGVAR
jgi:hypothetical protein